MRSGMPAGQYDDHDGSAAADELDQHDEHDCRAHDEHDDLRAAQELRRSLRRIQDRAAGVGRRLLL